MCRHACSHVTGMCTGISIEACVDISIDMFMDLCSDTCLARAPRCHTWGLFVDMAPHAHALGCSGGRRLAGQPQPAKLRHDPDCARPLLCIGRVMPQGWLLCQGQLQGRHMRQVPPSADICAGPSADICAGVYGHVYRHV